MTDAGHTPTPWEAHECGVYPKQLRKPGDPWESCIAATGDDPDPEHGGPNATEREQIANAAFIVRAVNTYEKIKAALNTEEDGDALVEVARNACEAEQRLAAIESRDEP